MACAGGISGRRTAKVLPAAGGVDRGQRRSESLGRQRLAARELALQELSLRQDDRHGPLHVVADH